MIDLRTASGTVSQTKDTFLDHLAGVTQRIQVPFSQVTLDVLADLSATLLKAKEARHAPQITALGYWLRPAAIKRHRQDFEARLQTGHIPTARGLAFHLPPANVDTLFVYSWVLSLLSGNSNVVRLPSTVAPLTEWLIQTVIKALYANGDLERHVFCAYDYRLGLNKDISALADLRMVWGGDAKVMAASADPVRPDGLSLGFSDRKSFSVIKSSAYDAADDAARDALADRLYNDIYWFDQLGCGSPRVVAWVGTPEAVSQDLYARLVRVAVRKGYDVETGIAMSKFAYMNDLLAEDLADSGQLIDNRLSVLSVTPKVGLLERIQGGGMILDTQFETITDILSLVDRRTQTITHFGFTEDEVTQMGHALVGKGGFRVVPVGYALSFEATWDGIVLLDHMTRRISVQYS